MFIGWGVSLDENKNVAAVFCPHHHPRGEGAVGNQIEAAELFCLIADRLSSAPEEDSVALGMLHDLWEMAELPPKVGPKTPRPS